MDDEQTMAQQKSTRGSWRETRDGGLEDRQRNRTIGRKYRNKKKQSSPPKEARQHTPVGATR